MQSWGTQSRFEHRDTDFEPSKSGVIGLLGSALGMDRSDDDLLRKLADLKMGVRVDSEGRLLRDYHTAGGGMFRGAAHQVHGQETVLSERFYLTGACFVVALVSNDLGMLERIAGALLDPVWPLYLGRRSCPPDKPILAGVAAPGGLKDQLRRLSWLGHGTPPPGQIRCVVESKEGSPRTDQPVSFRMYARQHTRRFVSTYWLDLSALPGDTDVP
jgi:CRISPR system Cascade subunit CasD